MKPQTFLRLSLSSPYVLWVICNGLLTWYNLFATKNEPSKTHEFLLVPIAFFVFGVFIWFVPYTILAFGLWFWSKNKPAIKIVKGFAFSPLMMMALVAIEVVIISFATGDAVSTDFDASVFAVSLLSIPFGYVIIGFVAGTYKLLQIVKVIKPEQVIAPLESTN